MKTLARIYPDRISYWAGDGHLRYMGTVIGKPKSIDALGMEFNITVEQEGKLTALVWADEIQKGDDK